MSATRPPPKLRVGYITYDVVFDARRTAEHDAEAIHVGNDGKIFLDPNLHPDVIRQHLVHELLHACVHAAQCDTEKTPAGENGEEFIVLAASPVLLEVIRDNPGLLTYLQARG